MTSCIAPPQKATQFDLDQLNQMFESAHPRDTLAWCLEHIPEGLVQSTAFGASGMVIMDLLYRELQPRKHVPVLFLDTLHHFPETMELVHRSQMAYELDLRIYKVPDVDSRAAFAARYGQALWETNIDRFYQLTKVEPLARGLQELHTVAWITGRRRDQAATREHMPIFEFDRQQRLKVNPLANWTNKDVWAYIMQHEVPYNSLYDQGYASIGDEPITTPIKAGEHERAGRWRGTDKLECGIHL